jgi:hypothetical protein
MSRKTKLSIMISAIAIALGISIMLVIAYNPTLWGIFQRATSEDDDDNNSNPSFDGSFGSVQSSSAR